MVYSTIGGHKLASTNTNLPMLMSSTPAMPDHSHSTKLDKFAVLLSGICIVHCLLAPVILTLLPVFAVSAVLEDVLFHKLMLWFVLPTSVIALSLGCKKHRDFKILFFGIAGMILLILIAFWGHDLLSPTQEKIATSIAGIVLAISHVLNYRACQARTCEKENCSTDHHH